MGLRGVRFSFGFTWLLATVLFKPAPMANSQRGGCTVQDIDLGRCFSQSVNSSIDIACCKALNQIVETGYKCLCSLLSSYVALLSTPLLLPLSNCYISVPSLTLCRVLAPMPVMLPPNRLEKNVSQPSVHSMDVVVPPPQGQIEVPLNLTKGSNHTEEQKKPHATENSVPPLYATGAGNGISNGKKKTKILAHQILLLLSLVLQAG
ncbi:hypothetical protein DITRI_Ditri15bG0081800 [Diplodiscus trichospermus]